MLAMINVTGYRIVVKINIQKFIPENMSIKLSVWEGYRDYNSKTTMYAKDIKLEN